MRFAASLLLLLPALACAQHAELHVCLDRLAGDTRFKSLAGKLDAGVRARPSSPLANSELATAADSRALKTWIAARGKCVESAEQEGNAVYRPPLTAIAIDAERRTLAEATALAEQKISFGEFNRRREAIDGDRQRKAAALNRRIQDQAAAFEADQRTRELEQVQRDAQEAERQANLAQQQLAGIEARRASRRYVPRQPVVPAPIDSFAYRTCLNRGSRIVCAPR